MGEVSRGRGRPVEDGVEVVRGAKGVDGGAVQVVGEHPAACDLCDVPAPARSARRASRRSRSEYACGCRALAPARACAA